MIVVLGGGVTGLAAARTLSEAGAEFLVLEKEDEPGGHCRSIAAGRYTFDLSGHFLHVSDAGRRARLLALPGVPWTEVARDARIRLRGRMTPYPFQANLAGHDPAFVTRCLAGFAAERIREAVRGACTPKDFAGWLRSRFGAPMCRAFFYPYNRKMWRTPLRTMTTEWTDWSVPVPDLSDLLAGARGTARQGMGYNATFLYPREGGIGTLVRALAAPLGGRIATGTAAASVDLSRRIVRTCDGRTIPFRAVVSTVPLPAMARLAGRAGAGAAASRLRWIKVLAINLGVRRPGVLPGHWVYVPERAYPFFRVGFFSNVAPAAAPDGCASLFVEMSFPAGARIDVGREVKAALRGLRAMGILRRESLLEEIRPVILDPAYVVFDGNRRRAVAGLRAALEQRGVFPAGRYGAWDYYGMDRSMADGARAAREAARYAPGKGP